MITIVLLTKTVSVQEEIDALELTLAEGKGKLRGYLGELGLSQMYPRSL